MDKRQRLRHICEVCGADELLTPGEAYETGRDYPLKMGAFGVISPRTCPNCPVSRTVWWSLAVDHSGPDMINPVKQVVVARIFGEPDSIAVPE